MLPSCALNIYRLTFGLVYSGSVLHLVNVSQPTDTDIYKGIAIIRVHLSGLLHWLTVQSAITAEIFAKDQSQFQVSFSENRKEFSVKFQIGRDSQEDCQNRKRYILERRTQLL